MVKRRVSMQVSPEFMRKLQELRIKIYSTGEDTNFRQLTEQIAEPRIFTQIEDLILNDNFAGIIKFDRRKK